MLSEEAKRHEEREAEQGTGHVCSRKRGRCVNGREAKIHMVIFTGFG